MSYLGPMSDTKDSTVNEDARLRALEVLNILDTPPEESFERITRLAKLVMNTPIVTIALVDRDRLWLKASIGMSCCNLPRSSSFCDRTIQQSTSLVIPDTRLDPDFQNNPFVVGAPHIRFYMGVPLRTAEGFNIGTLCVMDQAPRDPVPAQLAVLEDLAGLVIDELALRQLADVDSLTGTMTRRSFLRESKRAIAQSLRNHAPISCVAVDIDHFKAINDRFGHASGDLVLQAVASLCQRYLRPMDLFGRIGGEEFAILLPEAASDDAAETADRLRCAIQALLVPAASGSIQITSSFGVSSRNGREATIEALLAEADGALYEAKRCGRNRVAVAGDNTWHQLLDAGSSLET